MQSLRWRSLRQQIGLLPHEPFTPIRGHTQLVEEVLDTVKTRTFHARHRLKELLPGIGVWSHAG
jgi:hypothetical protein